MQSGRPRYRLSASKRLQDFKSSVLRQAGAFWPASQRACNSMAKGERPPPGGSPAQTVQMPTVLPACTSSHTRPPQEKATSSKWGERKIHSTPALYPRLHVRFPCLGYLDCHFINLVLSS